MIKNYHPKAYTPVFILVVVVFLMVVGLSMVYGQRSKATVPNNTPKNRQVNYDKAIVNGQSYLLDNFNDISPVERIMLDYLQRKYSLDEDFSAVKNPITFPVNSNDDQLQFEALKRLAYPNQLLDKRPLEAGQDPIGRMLIEAAYCDRFPVGSDFKTLMDSSINAGGYYLTHVSLALLITQDNYCKIFSDQELQSISQKINNGMQQLVMDPHTLADLRYEAIAFLLETNQRHLVQKPWIDQIVSEQEDNGGWKAEPNSLHPSNHTTVLALWSLLAYTHPTVPQEPLVRHEKSINR